jgi:hypothetical protein
VKRNKLMTTRQLCWILGTRFTNAISCFEPGTGLEPYRGHLLKCPVEWQAI